MKTLDDYLKLPELAREPAALREVHAIRLMIHKETKSMTAEERTAYYHEGTKDVISQLGIKSGAVV
jgi:Zn/Cd-binding protein ZinT